ncbi:hypothetical protein CAC42_1706 [Sphaceloma murrayae]|uniref:Uncharacterized protein n=1 Tax=Sphaceloma murrayae TaxID=2082308 RepID=A0A2K1QHQ4_9PEZI|nr:hypothetical protein CAC42_1706 [Sphaceloma murrayae]
MPRLVYDSEDESDDELSLPSNGSIGSNLFHRRDNSVIDYGSEDHSAPQHAQRASKRGSEVEAQPPSTRLALQAAAMDLFDIQSTFGSDGTADKPISKKRRKTAGEVGESPRKKPKGNARSQSTRHYNNVSDSTSRRWMEISEIPGNEEDIGALQGAGSFKTQAARENVLLPPSSGDLGECVDVNGARDDGQASGDTIRMATDEQQLMLQQALNAKSEIDGGSHNRAAEASVHVSSEHTIRTGHELHHSSNSTDSIPWSAGPIQNTQTPSTGSKKRSQSSQSARASTSGKSARRAASEQVTPSQVCRNIDSSQASHDEQHIIVSAEEVDPIGTQHRMTDEPFGAERTSRSQALEAQLPQQDDLTAIGLPKERYRAKPSRSRSAAIEYEPVDWSVPPERLMKQRKNKRTKTAGAVQGTDIQIDEAMKEQIRSEAEFARRAREAREEDSSADKARVSGLTAKASGQAMEIIADPANGQDASALAPEVLRRQGSLTTRTKRNDNRSNQRSDELESGRTNNAKEPSGPGSVHPNAAAGNIDISEPNVSGTSPSQQETVHSSSDVNVAAANTAATDKPVSTPDAFLMPPPSSTSSRKKKPGKRSHTTIFEDHVGLRDHDRTEEDDVVEVVSLKQQQATRKKRGRPRKQPKAEEEVAETQETALKPSDDGQAGAMAQPPSNQATAKRGRGRPKKVVTVEPVQQIEETQADESERRLDRQPEQPVVAPAEDDDLFAVVDAEREAESARVAEGITRSPNGSQECGTERSDIGTGKENTTETSKTASREVSAAQDRQMHSPIKKGVTVYRVGLSRKQRIQPLLRMLKR